jgi:hypothetical protein
MSDDFKTGDPISIGYGERRIIGRVRLASANGRSLMLEFEGILGGHVGMMPVLLGEDALFRSIVTQEVVQLRRPAPIQTEDTTHATV